MKNVFLRNIGIADFKLLKHKIDYMDEDFIAVRNLCHLPYDDDEMIRLDCFVIAFCSSGKAEIKLNSRTYNWEKQNWAMILPNTYLNHIECSDDFLVDVVVFSPSFIKNIFILQKDMWDVAMYIHDNPIKSVGDSKFTVLELYAQLLRVKIEEGKNSYNKEIIRHVVYAMFIEILHEINKWIPESGRLVKNDLKQCDYIFKSFIEKVAADDGSHRSVSYYADLLFYSPKYLSKIVRHVSGKVPLEIIHDHATEQIKYKLKHSDMSIKEISNYFNFPNPSFFGKYVKIHLGMSPKKYREMLSKGN